MFAGFFRCLLWRPAKNSLGVPFSRTLYQENSMPRQPKPYFRKAQKRWVCTINGNRITLGKTKDEAMAKYHQLMLKPHTVSSELSTIYDLSQVLSLIHI